MSCCGSDCRVAANDVATALAVIAFFAMLGDIETSEFDVFGWSQSHDCFDCVRDDEGANNRKQERDADGLNLFHPKPAVGNELGQSIRFACRAKVGNIRIAAVPG